MTVEVETVPLADALAMLADGDTIPLILKVPGETPTYDSLPRGEVIEVMQASPFINRTTGKAKAAGHGIVVLHTDTLWFVKTKEPTMA